ncbi:MGH1-like glycoside hydrolase domain-containing protein [Nonomuraea sp. SYSU D8015]|uniref:MGH1-like glycoside hydrolase domain-containing protein n=1 Tax=Nonomuraea sp. SYSU D8015 TaxID=2593644 RepID=UPI001660F696|nr:NEW3 domain-containing protein [Nonomuraea sp. SYSU D8015]
MRRTAAALALLATLVAPTALIPGPASATPKAPPPAYPEVGRGTAFLDHRALLSGLAEPEWYEANIPFLEVPDREIQDVYYYRWSTFKRHIRYTDSATGHVITEFHHAPGYAAPLGGIVAAAGHHVYEGRWLRDRRPIDDYLAYWLQGPGAGPKPKEDYVNEDTDDWAHQYAWWAADAAYQRYLVTGEASFVEGLLPDLVRQYDKWGGQYDKELGLYWSVPVWDAMEYTASSYETDPADPYHGGAGYRPTLNAYQYGDAKAIAAIARMRGDQALARTFEKRAESLRDALHRHLWDPERSFFYHKARADLDPQRKLVSTREQIGFAPWAFGMAEPGTERAWAQLLDPQGFAAPYGPATAERRSPFFMREAFVGCCRWNGPSWPYSTSTTLTALANLLNDRDQDVVTAADYYQILRGYALTQYKNGRPYVAEAHHPDEPRWIYDGPGHSEHYNHSTFNDLVISGLIGLRPRADGKVVVNPLAPAEWDHFALENVPYHGHNVTVLWDRDGTRYGQGKGLRLYVNGRLAAVRPGLGELTARVPAAVAPDRRERLVNDAANPHGTGHPRPFASYTNGFDDVWDAVDGRIFYDDIPHSRWTNYRSPNPEDHLGVDFGVPTRVSDVRFHAYDDGGGVRAPASYRLEFWDGAAWREVPGQVLTPERPAGAELNRITFPELTTTRIRLVFANPPGAYVGVTELQAWSPTAGDTRLDAVVTEHARPGAPATVATTFANRGGKPATRVKTALAVLPGWSAEPVGRAETPVVRPGGEFTVRWRVSPPPGTTLRAGMYPVRALATYDRAARAVSAYAQVEVAPDPVAYPKAEVRDTFATDTSAGYTVHRPFDGEAAPAIAVGGGRFAGSGAQPYFGLVTGPAGPSSAEAMSMVTAGSFAGTGSPEDSVFVGWVKDKDNYVTAWYNHTRQQSGINVRVGGRFLDTPGDAALTLKPGDRFALVLSGDTITSYAHADGAWRRLRTAGIGDTLATPQARAGYRHGFGLRATSGTIAVAGLEGRSS